MSKKCNPCNYIYRQTSNLSSRKIWPPLAKSRGQAPSAERSFIVWLCPPCQQNCPTFMSKKRQHGRATSFYHLRIDTCPNIKDRMRKRSERKKGDFLLRQRVGGNILGKMQKYICVQILAQHPRYKMQGKDEFQTISKFILNNFRSIVD